MNRRVVITGIGMISPLGVGTRENWEALKAGVSGIGHITKFDTTDYPVTIAGEVKGFDPLRWHDKKELRRIDTFIQYAIAATSMALEDASLKIQKETSHRIGVLIGSGIGGMKWFEDHLKVLLASGPRKISPFFIPGMIVNLASGMVSMRWGLRGPNSAVCTACATGMHAIGDAYQIIRRGDADRMIAGGTEAVIVPIAVAGFASMRALSTRNDEPEKASRPFEKNRDGFVLGEGAGILVLEELEHATDRGAEPYAEIVGYGMSGDAFHMSAPSEDGDGAVRVMKATLDSAGVDPSEVDCIKAHGTATPVGDRVETLAIKRLFGDHARRVAISAPKSMMGHLLGAAGGIETAMTALAIRDGIIPPTINYDEPDPECDLDYVPNKSRKATIRYALANSFGFGGTNASLLLKKVGA